jgi:hypothetical protein
MQKRRGEAASERDAAVDDTDQIELHHLDVIMALRRIRKEQKLNMDVQVAIWLLDFVQRDLDQLSTGQWMDLAYEVSCLSQLQWVSLGMWHLARIETDWDGGPVPCRSEDYSWLFIGHEDVMRQLDADLFPLPSFLPAHAVIRRLQTETLKFLEEVWESHSKHQTVEFEIPALHGRLAVVPDRDKVIVLGYAPDPYTVFRCNVVGVVLATAARLRRCRECRKWFYADRSNKFYCTARCQSRAGTRRNPPKPKPPEGTQHPTQTATPPTALRGDASKEQPMSAGVKTLRHSSKPKRRKPRT